MNRNRKKLLEAILFFSSKQGVKHPSKMMMYKLLAELDFRHFHETGLPVLGLNFRAYKWGPLPEKFHEEITKNDDLVIPSDFADSIYVEKIEYENKKGELCKMFLFKPRRKPDLKIFSPRQQDILKEVVDIYKNATPTEASKASHEPNTPWTKTVNEKGEEAIINLVDTVKLEPPLTKEIAQERLRERDALIYNLGG